MRDAIFSFFPDNEHAETKDFVLKPGGKRDGRQEHTEVCDWLTREQPTPQQRKRFVSGTRICLAARARWSHLNPCRTQK